MSDMSPMMKQYLEIKKEYPDTILMFRLGDFYEMFFDDAKLVSNRLSLTLTERKCGNNQKAPMCGVPFHSAETYISRLIAQNFKIAICEQVEDPSTAQGIVKRKVVRVLTPGTVIESSMLDEEKNNYVAAVCLTGDECGICFTDISTGAVFLTALSGDKITDRIINEFGRYMPTEVIVNNESTKTSDILEQFKRKTRCIVNVFPDRLFDIVNAKRTVYNHFGRELDIDSNHAISALGAMFMYLGQLQQSELANIKDVNFYTDGKYMEIDFSSRRNLELVETMRNRERRGSLLWVLDKAKSSMGKRLLRTWVERPLLSLAQISKRHNAVDELVNNTILRSDISATLEDIRDIERIMARVVYKTANPRDLRALAATFQYMPTLKAMLKDCTSEMLERIHKNIDELNDLYQLIDASIDDKFEDGNIIREGYNAELDELKSLFKNNTDVLKSMEEKEIERTGIKKLKIGFNRVAGYFIDVPKSSIALVPDEYIRKQTLTNSERYITPELKDLEAKVLGAEERVNKLEKEIFLKIMETVAKEFLRVQSTAEAVATLDTLTAFATVAVNNNYTRPKIGIDKTINISEGRHPVVEQVLDGAPFVPNDTYLDNADDRCMIITGPNMAGKSTYMRQVALIVLMAQIGSFVPAKYADLCMVDKIFTRVGASDDLAAGQSTFMLEMVEVANIIQNATENSLIIYDEIGRGTSTFDGMSIARAVLEHTANSKKLGAKTLFATHYHELTELEGQVDGVRNYNISVKKRGDEITFLRRIVKGAASGSYGIAVAKLAGIPDSVVNRAKVILKNLEATEKSSPVFENELQDFEIEEQVTMTSETEDRIIDELKKIDINTLTPIEALSKLYELVKMAEN